MDISNTIIRQYANSRTICRLLQDFADNMDPSAFIDLAVTQIFDPRTATGFGLDVWGRIVGVSRYLDVASDKFIGFAEASGLNTDTFDNAIFYNGAGAGSGSYALADEMYRKLIFAKAWSNISDCSVPSINGCLQILFSGSGRAYVQDNRDRSLTFIFEFTPDPAQVAIIEKSGVLPVPAGVAFTYEVKT